MTKEEFINKWSTEPEEKKAMEFDLVSVIHCEGNATMQAAIEAKIHERYEEEELPEKAEGVTMPEDNLERTYGITSEDAKKYVKLVTSREMKEA